LRGKIVDRKQYDQWKDQSKAGVEEDQKEMCDIQFCDSATSKDGKEDDKRLINSM
jgi:hypothetical protein